MITSQKIKINAFMGGSFLTLMGETLGFLILNLYVMDTFASAGTLALFNFLRLLPIPIMCSLSGYLSDNYSKRKLLIFSYTGSIFANILIFLYFIFAFNSFFSLIIVVFIRSLFSEMEPPLRYSLVPDIVPAEKVLQMTSNYTMIVNLSAILSPALLSLFIQKNNYLPYIFLFLSLSLVLVSLTIFKIDDKSTQNTAKVENKYLHRQSLQQQYKLLAQYLLYSGKNLFIIIMTSYAFMLCIFPFNNLGPAFAQNFLKISNSQYASVVMVSAIGGLLGSFLVRYLKSIMSQNLIYTSGFLAGLCLFLITLTQNLSLIILLFIFLGVFMQTTRSLNRIFIQIHAPIHLRGKLIALSLLDRAFIPFGTMIIGLLTYNFPIQICFSIFALAICTLYLAMFLSSKFIGQKIIMSKIFKIFIFFIISLFFITYSFAAEKDSSLQKQIEEAHIKKKPERVVSLCAAGSEMLAVFDISPIGYAVLNSGKLPDYLKPYIRHSTNVGNVATPSLERIKILNPDLIIIDRLYENQSDYINNLKKIAPVLDVRAENYTGMLKNIDTLAKLFGKEKELLAYTNKINKMLSDGKDLKRQNKKVLGIFISSRIIWGWTEKSFLVSLLKKSNITYAYEGDGSKYYSDIVQLSVEKILEINPDYLLIFDEPNKNSISFLEQSPAWKYLSAAKNNHIIKLDRDIWSRSKGPLSALVILSDLKNMLRI